MDLVGVFFKAACSYLTQLFGIFQSKLTQFRMDFDLDFVNPEEEEEGLEENDEEEGVNPPRRGGGRRGPDMEWKVVER